MTADCRPGDCPFPRSLPPSSPVQADKARKPAASMVYPEKRHNPVIRFSSVTRPFQGAVVKYRLQYCPCLPFTPHT